MAEKQKPRPAARTTLYRLIAAGHLARQALLRPLQDAGLAPGDDAILLALHDTDPLPAGEIGAVTGLDEKALIARLTRLARDGFVTAAKDETIALTEPGRLVADLIFTHWQTLETRLVAGLDAKDRKMLRQTLKRFIAGLSDDN